jgi:hypothetical protein
MEIDKSFVLNKGETLILKKKGGFTSLEFTRRNEKHLNDIIELEYKNSRSKKKDPSVWIIEKDFINRILYEINSCGFEFQEIKKIEKANKKNQNDSQ